MRFKHSNMCVKIEVLSDLPPRIGSVPWFAKSSPYKLSPSMIFCLHWVPGASWRTQSRTQGKGEPGPGLTGIKTCVTNYITAIGCFRSPPMKTTTWLRLSSRMSWGWIHPLLGPTAQTLPCRTCLAALYWSGHRRIIVKHIMLWLCCLCVCIYSKYII